jgi:hypothetical protein
MARERSEAERGNDGATGRAASDGQPTPGGGVLGLVFLPFVVIGRGIGKVWNAITDDGHLAAAGRQGIDELGAALKAFPDSIQREENGALWSPTQAEITASRKHLRHTGNHRSHSSLTPPAGWSAAADSNQHQAGNDHGHDNGHDAGRSM